VSKGISKDVGLLKELLDAYRVIFAQQEEIARLKVLADRPTNVTYSYVPWTWTTTTANTSVVYTFHGIPVFPAEDEGLGGVPAKLG
jgi:hypothetical protein